MGRPELPREAQVAFWDGIRAGLGVEEAAVAAGVNRGQGWRWLRAAGGGKQAAPRAQAAGRVLRGGGGGGGAGGGAAGRAHPHRGARRRGGRGWRDQAEEGAAGSGA